MVGAKRQVVNQGKRPARLNDVTTVTVRGRNTGKLHWTAGANGWERELLLVRVISATLQGTSDHQG